MGAAESPPPLRLMIVVSTHSYCFMRLAFLQRLLEGGAT
jgi:hypothetical protein